MTPGLRIPLPDSVRLRLADLHQQKAQIDRDMKTIVDTVLGMRWMPNDPLWTASIALDVDHILVTPKDEGAGG